MHALKARLVVEEGWDVPGAVERFTVSYKTAKKWADRDADEGPKRMVDRSSACHPQARRTPQPVLRKVVHVRIKQRLGPVEIGD